MKENWRFRTNWRGKLILQRRTWYWVYESLFKQHRWDDATSKDLLDYAKDHQ